MVSDPITAPLPRSRVSRHDPRQEPYAAIPLVQICAGGVRQLAFLPRPGRKITVASMQLLPSAKGESGVKYRFLCKRAITFPVRSAEKSTFMRNFLAL